MSNSITQTSFLQPDTEPLPIIISQKYSFPLQRYALDNDELVYSMQDWISGLTGETDTKKVGQMWALFQKQSTISNRSVKMPYLAIDGKRYQRDFGSNKVLFAFAAYVRAIKARPQIKEIKDFLAKAGAFTDDLQQDMETGQRQIESARIHQAIERGKSADWITTRELGVNARRQFTEAIHKANPDMHIGEATNGIYKGTFGMTAAELRKQLGIGEKQNPRDFMGELGLVYTMASEIAVRGQLAGYADNDVVPIPVIKSIITAIATITGKQAQEMADIVGVDLITGQKSIGSGK